MSTQGLPEFGQYNSAVRLVDESTLQQLLPPLPHGESELDEARRATFESLGETDPINRMMRLDLETSLAESLLLLTDKMTMAVSIETAPFLDHELVELAARVPGRCKIKGTSLRYVQKMAMRTCTRRSHEETKAGIDSHRSFVSKRLVREMTADVLSPSRIRRQGLFEPQIIQGMLEAHMRQREDYSDALLGLLTFCLWSDSAHAS